MASKHRNSHAVGRPSAPPAPPAVPVVPEAPPAHILIPPQQTVEAADEEAIRRRAYELWEQAGSPEGDGARFWYEAEREVHRR